MDDSFATPVSKLPPPVMTMRGEEAPIENLNYTDILNKIDTKQSSQGPASTSAAATVPPMPLPQQHQQMHTPVVPSTPVHGEYYMTQQPQYIPMQQPSQIMYADDMISMPAVPSKKNIPLLSTDTLRDKTLWLFAAIMFVAIIYGLPKLRQYPMFINQTTGGLSTLAIAFASAISGLSFTVAKRLI